MDLKFVEAGHPQDMATGLYGNWGKFAIGRYTNAELREPTRFPGCDGRHVVSLRGWGSEHIWVFDLATGEAARFHPVGYAIADLSEHRVWVCPLFEPFLTWLYRFIREHPYPQWWDDLPRTVELSEADFAFGGHRRSSYTATRINTEDEDRRPVTVVVCGRCGNTATDGAAVHEGWCEHCQCQTRGVPVVLGGKRGSDVVALPLSPTLLERLAAPGPTAAVAVTDPHDPCYTSMIMLTRGDPDDVVGQRRRGDDALADASGT